MKTKTSEKNKFKKQEEIIFEYENQTTAIELLKEVYLIQKKQKNKLSPEQEKWITKVERLFGKNKIIGGDFICSVLENTYYYLNKTEKWNEVDDKVYEMFEKIIFLNSKAGAFKEVFDTLEKVIHSTLSLDFSNKAIPCQTGPDERNVINYAIFALNMLIEKIETSMVSVKATNIMLEAPQQSTCIVTDTSGKIRFINSTGEKLFHIEQNEYLYKSVYDLLSYNQLPLKKAISDCTELSDIKTHLLIEKESIPVYLTLKYANKEDDEIHELVFIIRTWEQVAKEKDKNYPLHTQENNYYSFIKEIQQLLKYKAPKSDSQHLLLSFLEESAAILKSDYEGLLQTKNTISVSEIINLEFVFDKIIDGLKYTEGYSEVVFYKDILHTDNFYSNSVLVHSILQKLITTAIMFRNKNKENNIRFIVHQTYKTHFLLELYFTCKKISIDTLTNFLDKDRTTVHTINTRPTELISVKEAIKQLKGNFNISKTTSNEIVFSISLPCFVSQ